MGVYLSEPNTAKNTKTGVFNKMAFYSVEMQGWRKNMEDAAIHQLDIGDGNSLFAVFDGHGGPEVSECVRQIFVPILKETSQYGKKNYVQALDIAFEQVDKFLESQEGTKKLKEIRSKGSGNSEYSYEDKIVNGTGCTANVVLITPEKYIIANAGDSRSALCRNSNCIVFSQDHKPESPIQEARIRKAGAVISMGRVNGGLNLTRSFGDFDYKQNKSLKYDQQAITCKPDIKEVDRDESDQFIIVGCDGIWEKYVDNSQGMIDLLKKDMGKKNCSALMEDLLDLLLARDTREGLGCDNMTAILITLK